MLFYVHGNIVETKLLTIFIVHIYMVSQWNEVSYILNREFSLVWVWKLSHVIYKLEILIWKGGHYFVSNKLHDKGGSSFFEGGGYNFQDAHLWLHIDLDQLKDEARL